MATISTVVLEPNGRTRTAQWAQPFLAGDDALDWYVTTDVMRKVQRNRLTDDVYWCAVEVAPSQTGITVVDGAPTSPAVTWVAENLTGLRFRLNGQDGSTIDAVIDGTDPDRVDTTLRDGHMMRSRRSWVHAEVVSGGTTPVGTKLFGVHVYRHDMTPFPDGFNIVPLEVRVTNASCTRLPQGAGIQGARWNMYLTGGALVPPVGWGAVALRTLPTSGNHIFPCWSGTTRRYVLFELADPQGSARAQAYLDMFWYGYARTGRSYLSVPSYLAHKTLQPDLDLAGYTYQGQSGYNAAKVKAAERWNALSTAVANGTANTSVNLHSVRMGFFHALNAVDPAGPDGNGIMTHPGTLMVRDEVRFSRLGHDLAMDGAGIYVLNEANGRPWRPRDFAELYTIPGSLGPAYQPYIQWLGRSPMICYSQANAGYEYNNPHSIWFRGHFPPDYPPHTLETRQLYPDGSPNPYYNNALPHYWFPHNPANWGPAPLSQNLGTCDYQRQLITQPNPHPTFEDYFTGLSTGVRDPQDDSHFSRETYNQKATIWLCGDLVTIDDQNQQAEFLALAVAETGHVPIRNPNSGIPDDLNSAPNSFSLRRKWERSLALPNQCVSGAGRDTWALIEFATQFALATTAERDDGYTHLPVNFGIRKRVEMAFEWLLNNSSPNGATYYIDITQAGQFGQLGEMWNPPPPGGVYEGDPLPPHVQGMQIGLELPIYITAFMSLREQLDDPRGVDLLRTAFAHHTAITGEFTYYNHNTAGALGPKKYCGVRDRNTGEWVNGAVAERAFVSSGNPGFPNHACMVEYAFRATAGDEDVLDVALLLGPQGGSGMTYAQRATVYVNADDARQWGGGTIAALLGQFAFAPPAAFTDMAVSMVVTTELEAELEIDVPVNYQDDNSDAVQFYDLQADPSESNTLTPGGSLAGLGHTQRAAYNTLDAKMNEYLASFSDYP
jgi:hypothetical protein